MPTRPQAALMLALALAGAYAVTLALRWRAESPRAIVAAFLDARRREDFASQKRLVAARQRRVIDAEQRIANEYKSDAIGKEALAKLVSFEIEEVGFYKDEVIIWTKEQMRIMGHVIPMEQRYMVIRDAGAWRIDLGRTHPENTNMRIGGLETWAASKRKKQ